MEENHRIRAELRKRFLQALIAHGGHQVRLVVDEAPAALSAVYEACDVDTENVAVSELRTTIGVQPKAVLRVNDIVSLTFANKNHTTRTK